MNNFEYYNPVRVIFGPGELNRVGAEAKALGQNICIVSYKELGLLSSVIDRVKSLLEKEALSVFTFFEAEPNPEIETIARGAAFCKDNDIDLVIGIGGGSAMDAAKAIAAGVYYHGGLWSMVYSRHSHVEAVPPSKALPTLMIPTLPATGSEMNQCAVLSNAKLKEKSYIWAECLYPRTSIIDPELTISLPPFQTACAAADAISHVLEIYINGEEDSDLQHYFQEGVMRTIIDNIFKVLDNPLDISARSHLQWAATCAINGWASPGDAWTPIHQIGHVLTSCYRVPHGASLSILMPAWMEYMWSRRKDVYYRFAVNVMQVNSENKDTTQVIQEGLKAFKEFLKSIGVPLSLKEYSITEEEYEPIFQNVAKVSFGDDGYLKCNPPVSKEDIKEVLMMAK